MLAGVLLALAFPPATFLLPSFVGLAPLLVFIARRRPGAAGRWSAVRGALLTGVVFFGIRLYWMVVALADRSVLAVPAYVLTVLVLASVTGAFGWAAHYTRERLALPLPILAAVFWTAAEWVQGHLGPLSFPWLALGTSLSSFPRLAGAADLVGATGLTAWLAAVNGALAALLLGDGTGSIRWRAVAGTALLVLLPAGYGLARAAALDGRPAARIAVVQPNISPELKRDRALGLDSSLAVLARLTAGVAGAEPDLVVWPEVALPADLAGSRRLQDSLAALSRSAGAPILIGAYGLHGPADDATAFNSAFLVDGRGLSGDRYDKRALVPFIERVPFFDPRSLERFVGDLRYYGGLGRGDAATLFTTEAGARFGILICYESIFPRLAREYRAAGADFLVAITNDGWYARDTWYGRTPALWQHPGHLVLRAIETRTGVARAANTGFSLFIDPVGRIHGRTALFQAETRVETVLTTGSPTLFVRLGDWVGLGSLLAALVGILVAYRSPGMDDEWG
ncbi:MAG: apolipoprotein N-acyltransferase [Gemmatimonadetes bacterium]|nr:apolipoprotein N-acyltransferase [Gemmatimonadota bacterium]